ncbi:hypothetical protein FACS1894159_07410 [Bacteroidia bacterium]|nr:hypothetical protein FACS1894159_07410 [Bacteroidia bacterium]
MDIKKYTNLNTSYTDNSAHPGINEYAVVAVNNKGNSPIDDPLAFVSSEFIPLSTPTNLQCKVAMGNLFRLSWTNVPQATGYRVYISTLPDGTYSPKYKVSTNSNDAVFSYDGTSNPIYVKVQAVWESSYGNSNTIYSDFSNVVSVAFE